MTAAGMDLWLGTRRKQGWMLREVQRRLPGWHIEKRGEEKQAGAGWEIKSKRMCPAASHLALIHVWLCSL